MERAGESRRGWPQTRGKSAKLLRSEAPLFLPQPSQAPPASTAPEALRSHLAPSGQLRGHCGGTSGRGVASVLRVWVRSALPCARGFAISHFLSLNPRSSALYRLYWAPCALFGPSRLRAKVVASSACTPSSPTSLPLPHSPFPPPFRPRAGSGAGKKGRGHHVATPPEPAFSRAAAGGSPPAAQLASPGAHGSGPALRSASATPLPELRLQPARERALRATTPTPGSRLPALRARLSVPVARCPAPHAPRPRRPPSPCSAPRPGPALSLFHPSAPAHSSLSLLLACSFASSQTRRSSFAGKSQKPLQKADNEI